MGPIALIPAVIYVFMIASTTKATIFLIWCIIVGLMDNVLKPILLGRRASVPIAGVIGGFMAMGIIGLFVGAIVFIGGLQADPRLACSIGHISSRTTTRTRMCSDQLHSSRSGSTDWSASLFTVNSNLRDRSDLGARCSPRLGVGRSSALELIEVSK